MPRFNHIERRVRMIRLVERVNKQEEYSRKIGLIDESYFQSRKVKNEEN